MMLLLFVRAPFCAAGDTATLSRRKPQAPFPETHEAPRPNHQMIYHIDIEELACGDDLACHEHVLNTYMENHLTV